MGRFLKAIKSSFAAFVSDLHEPNHAVTDGNEAQLIGRIAAVAVSGAAFVLYCIPSDLGALKPTAHALLKLAKLLWTGKVISANPL